MAVTYGFFNSINGDRTYNADQMSKYFEGLVSDGVYESVGGALQVLAGSGMMVNVQTGRMIINSKWLNNDAVIPLTITAAHATLNRYTAIVARLDIANREMLITTKDGTPATSPVKPTMANTANTVEKCLAYVYVGKGVTSITQANITDTRPDNTVCGWVTGIVEQVDTSTLFLQWQTAYQEFYESFQSWFDTLTSQLQVNTYITSFEKRVTGTASAVGIVPLDMSGYTYEESDVLFVYINGLAAAETYDWLLDTRQNPPEIHVDLVGSSSSNNEVFIKILKSKIGDPVSGGGSSFKPKKVSEGVSSASTITTNMSIEGGSVE